MRTNSKIRKSKFVKKRREPQTVEDAYKRLFMGVNPSGPARERLSMYKSVPVCNHVRSV